MIDPQIKERLIKAAKEAQKNAYSIISNFPVGAAILTIDNHIYKGCNTESVISGLGVCAERSAIDHAICNGEYNFKAIAVTSNLEKPIYPCGMCRQYISEFSQIIENDIEIILVGQNNDILETSIFQLINPVFGPKDLGINLTKYKK